MRESLIESCKYVRQKLSQIGDLYLKYLSLYNSYKHGFRVGAALSGNPSDPELHATVLWPSHEERFDELTFMRLGQSENLIKKYQFMGAVLTAVTRTFEQRILQKKETFNVVAWGPNETHE